jgi:hypothetical protein
MTVIGGGGDGMAQGGEGGGAAARGTGGLEEEVKDPGAVFPTEILNNADLLRASEASRDNAEDGLAIGFEVAGDGHGNAAGIGEEDALIRARRIHGAETEEVQFQALTRGLGVDGAIAFIGDAFDDGDHPALAADQFGAEALPGQVIAAASHHHVDAEIEIIEGGGDGVAIEDATGTGIEAEKVKQGLNAPAIGSTLDDILAESSKLPGILIFMSVSPREIRRSESQVRFEFLRLPTPLMKARWFEGCPVVDERRMRL